MYEAELKQQNIPVDKDGGEFSITEWEQWSDKFILATQAAFDKYSKWA